MDDLSGESPTIASALPGAGGLFAGRFELREPLGRGAVKEVRLAYDTQLDREVALAIVRTIDGEDEAARERIKREWQVTARLEHTNIVTVFDSGECDGRPYLVLQAMKGGSLAERLERSRPSLAQTIRLGREIARALEYAHEHGVVHRDVKPDNVWLTDDGTAALGDFGIAQQAGLDRLTRAGFVVGTPRYLSPEQFRGDAGGPASDLYALGVTLYELVTGRAPFTTPDPAKMWSQHQFATPVPPSQHEPAVPPRLERLILELLAKSPADRPSSAAAVADELGEIERQPAEGTEATAHAAALRPAPAPSQETASRRIVSVLAAAADIEDPEALHIAFDRCAAVIERHGGTVERYLGDSLVGFFGLIESRGDDALRATRAAVELQAQTPAMRLGIETGELFLRTGPNGATTAIGGAIRAAGRLAEHAAQGQILLGERIRRSVVADAVVDEATGGLLELRIQEPALLRVAGTPFVGRARELDELRAAFARVRDERTCRVVTVAGPTGIGKSRLAGEFLTTIGDEATVLAGRCLDSGEGTAYRALADIVRGLGEDPRARVEELLEGDEQAIRGVLGAAGLSHEVAQVEETAWALRRLFERLGRERPLVVAFEDIHWAQGALLDLLEHVSALSSGAPMLLVCLTRPELLESRPQWVAPQPNRSVIVLDALGASQARELADALGAGELAGAIADRAEGNPLFVEQLVAFGAGQGDELPASIQAVLTTRIDALDVAERMVLQRAAIEGRTFHTGALKSMLPELERRGVSTSLVALARKGLIGADRSEFAGEEASRFTHDSIREAAYAGVPKFLRAELHAAVADWLEPRAADEIVGYHLEQAWRLRSALGPAGEPERALARRAAAHLDAASHAARLRGDAPAESALLERAVALLEYDKAARGALLPALGASLLEAGRVTDATRVLDDAIVRAPAPRLEARARIEREFVRLETETTAKIEGSRAVADSLLPLLELEHDEAGQGRVWSLRAQVAWIRGRVGDADAAWCEAAALAQRTQDERELFHVLRWRATAAVLGPTPVDEAILLCDEFRGIVHASPAAVAWTSNALAVLHAMRGEFALAEQFITDANETLDQLGGLSTSVSHHEALVRLLAGQFEQAEGPLRAGVDRLARLGDGALLATTTAMLAQAVYAQGRTREAAELCDATAAAAPGDDTMTQVIWRGVKAKTLAAEGHCDEAAALAGQAITLVEPTDLLSHHGDALLDLAEVLRMCSRPVDARDATAAALRLYEAKGNVAAAERARACLLICKG